MMIIGQTIFAEIVSDSLLSTEVYTPWFPRQGDGVTTTFEVIAISASFSTRITIDVLEKDSEDTGEGTAKSASGNTRTTTGVTSFRVTACKELVRYRIKLDTGLEPTGTHTLYAHFRILSPSWEATGYQGV